VYAENGALVDSTSVSATNLPDQVPNAQLTLLKNFKGQVKSIHFWQQFYALPIQTSETDSLLFALDFQKKNYQQGGWQPKNDPSSFTLPASEGRSFYFLESEVPAETINYTRPSQLGVQNSKVSLWDGGGCTDN
jgi:hypothetical protein